MDQKVRVIFEMMDRMGEPMRKANMGFDAMQAKIGGIDGAANKMGFSMNQMFGAIGGAVAAYKLVDGIKNIGKASLNAAGEMEQYSVALETMLGNRQDARARMDEYVKIATQTPFELSEVVEAGNKLQALGKYSEENLLMLGDLAAATGKPLDQVMNAYAKLASGQKGEAKMMFQDLLISTQDWVEATGKGVSKGGEMMAGAEEMMAALPKIMSKKGYMGMMLNQSKTMKGMASNTSDAWFQLKASIGERMAPAYKDVLRSTGQLIDMFKDWVEIPTVQKLRNERLEVNFLTNELVNQNTPQQRRLELYGQLMKIAPDLLKGIDKEKLLMGDLAENTKLASESLEKYNKESMKKILIKADEAKYEQVVKEGNKLQAKREAWATNAMGMVSSLPLSDAQKQELDELLIKTDGSAGQIGKIASDYILKTFPHLKGVANPIASTAYELIQLQNYAKKDFEAKLKIFNNEREQEEWFNKIEEKTKKLGLQPPAPQNTNDGEIRGTPSGIDPLSSVTSGINQVYAGGNNVKHITINIEKLSENHINSQTAVESIDEFADKLNRVLLDVLADVEDVM